jgi:hypothetical protein
MDRRPHAHTGTAGDGERLISSTKKNAAQQRPVLLHRSGKQKLNSISTILARLKKKSTRKSVVWIVVVPWTERPRTRG